LITVIKTAFMLLFYIIIVIKTAYAG